MNQYKSGLCPFHPRELISFCGCGWVHPHSFTIASEIREGNEKQEIEQAKFHFTNFIPLSITCK